MPIASIFWDPLFTVATLGNYDGVHRGHQRLVAVAMERSRLERLSCVAVFFDPHPATFLASLAADPKSQPWVNANLDKDRQSSLCQTLTPPPRRVELLRQLGIDRVVIEPFDRVYAQQTPETFVRQVLLKRLRAKVVVVGADFRFGHERSGNVGTLSELGRQLGFAVEVVDKVVHDGEPISSSRVRRALRGGDLQAAGALLGRLYDIDGEVVAGAGRGRQLGTATANLRCDGQLLPEDGVYAVFARSLDADNNQNAELDATGAQTAIDDMAGSIGRKPSLQRRGGADGGLLLGVANLGVRPTFEGGRSVEVHLLDFNADLYGQRWRVAFAKRLRAEQRFSDVDALRQQIGVDISDARRALENVAQELTKWV